MKEHNYKDFILKRSGYSKTPWNIYTKEGDWLGYAETLKQSKLGIDDGCYDEEAKAAKKMREINKKINEKKKKPAFGAFVTLDAGDVEKTIDTFNNSTVSDTGEAIMGESLNENIEDFINVTSMEQMREGSIDNMDDEDIDFQEKTFAHISRMLKANDADIVAIEYSSGYYDYDPDYLDRDIETKTFRYGELCNMDGIKFYKEAKYPFLYFRNEDDLNKYIEMYNKEMEYDI